MYLRLQKDGHDVKVSIRDPACHGTLAGLVERTNGWEAELGWIEAAGADGMVLFENVAHSRGIVQDELRAKGLRVIGGSAFGDRLENDREFAQSILNSLGLPTLGSWTFQSRGAALAFLDQHPGRYVLKFNGPGFSSSDNHVGRLADGRDIRALISGRPSADAPDSSFILMEHVGGIEMGVGAYFNGERFLCPACLDWEHKRFFTGDLGELTGEMGTVVTFDRTAHFFDRTLGKMASLLRANRYVGYINLNTIVNEQGIWPLEFTCRFGYPGYAILDPLQVTPWADLFAGMIRRSQSDFQTRSGFAVGIVLTTPPFPYTRHQIAQPVGLPVLFDGPLSDEDRANLQYGEVGLQDGELVTSGIYGWTMVATGRGPTIRCAQDAARALADRVLAPNIRYRRDIGDRLGSGDYETLEAWGMFGQS
jgi:phosphoribosylamine--glycine ligase